MSADDKFVRYAADGNLTEVKKCLKNGTNVHATNEVILYLLRL